MTCHGGFSLDEGLRRSWYNPTVILEKLTEGMTFVDVGSGEGYFSLLAAKKVGANGKIYAVDVDPSGVEKLKQQAAQAQLGNISAVVAKAEDTVFCHGCADMVFYGMNLHDFQDPVKVLRNAHEMLKPSGVLVDLDWKKISWQQQGANFGPPEHIRFSEQKASELLSSAGFKVESIKDAGPYHYVVTAKPI